MKNNNDETIIDGSQSESEDSGVTDETVEISRESFENMKKGLKVKDDIEKDMRSLKDNFSKLQEEKDKLDGTVKDLSLKLEEKDKREKEILEAKENESQMAETNIHDTISKPSENKPVYSDEEMDYAKRWVSSEFKNKPNGHIEWFEKYGKKTFKKKI